MTAWMRCLPVGSNYNDTSIPNQSFFPDLLCSPLPPSLPAAGTPCVDLLLLMSAKEGDTPKVEELLEAGADPTIKDKDGKTPLELATKDEVIELLEAALSKAAA